MIRQNLHCHTTFDDGADSPEAMVLAAESAGLRSIGVSAHAFIPGEEDWCIHPENEPVFAEEMHRLRDKYAGRIEVWCGLEYDIIGPRNFAPYDYIIASCHIADGLSFDNTMEEAQRLVEHFGGGQKAAQVYYERVASIADIPEADIVGHFDLLTKYNEKLPLYDTSTAAYRDAAYAAMEKLNNAGKIFEINSGAIFRGYRSEPYPAAELLRHLHTIGGRICISSDAHCTAAMICAFDRCEALARDCGFTELWEFNGNGFEPAAF